MADINYHAGELTAEEGASSIVMVAISPAGGPTVDGFAIGIHYGSESSAVLTFVKEAEKWLHLKQVLWYGTPSAVRRSMKWTDSCMHEFPFRNKTEKSLKRICKLRMNAGVNDDAWIARNVKPEAKIGYVEQKDRAADAPTEHRARSHTCCELAIYSAMLFASGDADFARISSRHGRDLTWPWPVWVTSDHSCRE
uniref:Uncharacterized protein n=1 Tax=Oryza glumipatula TaxID=40148 RepID=A0A0D9ZNG7_9ORYZ